MSKLETEIQKLAPSALLEFFEIDFTPKEVGSTNKYYFHAGTNKLIGDIVWQGITYAAWPVEVTGFARQAGGALPRIHVSIGNKDGLLTLLALNFNDFLGAKLTRRRTFAKFLDAINFPGGTNPDADASVQVPDDIFYLIQKIGENRLQIELEFAAEFDMEGIMLPRRQVNSGVCPWVYRGAECAYAGAPVADDLGAAMPVTPLDTAAPFDEYNSATSYTPGMVVYYRDARRVFVNILACTDIIPLDPDHWKEDRCGKRLSDCKLRPRTGNVFPYGGFPGSAKVPNI